MEAETRVGWWITSHFHGAMAETETWIWKCSWSESAQNDCSWQSPHSTACVLRASSSAYGAVAYLVANGDSKLITSKARVTPLKTRTLPQMELTAIQVGHNLVQHLKENLDLNLMSVVVWSDSEVALQWVRNNNCNIPYVRNRVAQIRDSSSQVQFRHVPGKENPADLLSRGTNMKTFVDNQLWL